MSSIRCLALPSYYTVTANILLPEMRMTVVLFMCTHHMERQLMSYYNAALYVYGMVYYYLYVYDVLLLSISYLYSLTR